jgi:hypothetical protein
MTAKASVKQYKNTMTRYSNLKINKLTLINVLITSHITIAREE